MSETPVTVPFVSFRPMERELDADLRGAFARVLDMAVFYRRMEDFLRALALGEEADLRRAAGKAYRSGAVTEDHR